MRRWAGASLALGVAVAGAMLALPGLAQSMAPDRSLIPQPRPGAAPVIAREATRTTVAPEVVRVVVEATARAPARSLRPAARPGGTPVPARGSLASRPDPSPPLPATITPFPPAAASPVSPELLSRLEAMPSSPLAVGQSLRPASRPDGLERRVRAVAARTTPARVAQPGSTRGSVCGQPGLIGERLDPIVGRISGCGIAQPVRLRSVDGVALTQAATINCDTARTLQQWVRDGVLPAVGRRGGGVANLRVVASYACRTRNSQPGARLSEHARGNAIDIAGIGLADGSELTVLGGWNERRTGRMLREMHSAACGPFGTVLGPESDRFHRDHFHFDTASYRSGPYCR